MYAFYLDLSLKDIRKLQLVQNAVGGTWDTAIIWAEPAASLLLDSIQCLGYHLQSPLWHGLRLSGGPPHPNGTFPSCSSRKGVLQIPAAKEFRLAGSRRKTFSDGAPPTGIFSHWDEVCSHTPGLLQESKNLALLLGLGAQQGSAMFGPADQVEKIPTAKPPIISVFKFSTNFFPLILIVLDTFYYFINFPKSLYQWNEWHTNLINKYILSLVHSLVRGNPDHIWLFPNFWIHHISTFCTTNCSI